MSDLSIVSHGEPNSTFITLNGKKISTVCSVEGVFSVPIECKIPLEVTLTLEGAELDIEFEAHEITVVCDDDIIRDNIELIIMDELRKEC